jgi:hypothetical protein
MKKIIALAVVVLSFGAVAAEKPMNCTAVHAIAHNLMEARQNGMAQQEMKRIIDANRADNEAFHILATALMNETYKQSVKPTANQRVDATVKFAGESMRLCYQLGGK